MENKPKKRKIHWYDWLFPLLEIASPVVALLCTLLIKGTDIDTRLMIISAGIVLPILTLQLHLILSSKKNEENDGDIQRNVVEIKSAVECLSDVKRKVIEMDEKINYLSPILEKAFVSKNDRLRRFVYRRMDETIHTVNVAIATGESGELKQNEYYEELLYLQRLLVDDKKINSRGYVGEAWAMTSFSDEEWAEDEIYEARWREKLVELCDKGVTTRRLCVISQELCKLIDNNDFSIERLNSSKSAASFIGYLKDVSSTAKAKENIKSYYTIESDKNKLPSEYGFFAVKLHSGEYHILHGETVNEQGALTASVLFAPERIAEIRNRFEMFARETMTLSSFLSKPQYSSFNAYIKTIGIAL